MLGEGNTNIVVATVGPTLDNYWTGAANDGDLSNSANWKSGVSTTGNANIYCTTNSTLTKGETFAPTSITFLGGSAAATVNGEFSGITQIANNSLSPVEFKDAVVFSGNVDVVQNTGAVKFTGGATGVKLANKTDIHGTYNFTTTGDSNGDLVEIADTAVKSDGKFVFANTSDGYIFSGGLKVQDTATVEVKPNAKPGKGTITLGAGTTLALTAASNEFTALANTVNLPTGENEKATIRIDGRRLKIGEHTLATVASGTTANVTLDMTGAALYGRKRASLAVNGSNLVLTIEPSAMIIVVR